MKGGKQFQDSFTLGRSLRDPLFRKALRSAGWTDGMVVNASDVLDAIRPDGRGGWTVLRKIKPVQDDIPPIRDCTWKP